MDSKRDSGIVGCEVPLMAATLVSFTNVNGAAPDRFPVFSGPHCRKRIIHEKASSVDHIVGRESFMKKVGGMA